MPRVNIETLKAAVSTLGLLKSQGTLSIEGEYKLVAFTMLLERLEAEERDDADVSP